MNRSRARYGYQGTVLIVVSRLDDEKSHVARFALSLNNVFEHRPSRQDISCPHRAEEFVLYTTVKTTRVAGLGQGNSQITP